MLADNDRLMTALFVAILMHGVVILGITFESEAFSRIGSSELEVVLIQGDSTDVAPEDANYYADVSQIGSGNTEDKVRASASPSSADPFANEGDIDGNALEKSDLIADEAMRQYLAARNSDQRSVLIQAKPNVLRAENRMQARLMVTGDAVIAPLEQEDQNNQVTTDNKERDMVVSINAKETNVAGYINDWRSKVERIGTLNYPTSLLQKDVKRSPVIEVSIAKNGVIRKAEIVRSSGSGQTDQAALRILRLASPFDPFPKELYKETDTLTFVYEWHFSKSGKVQGRARF